MSKYVIPDGAEFMSDDELIDYYENLIFDLSPNGHVSESYDGERVSWTVYGPNGSVLKKFERYDYEPYLREVD